MIETYLENNKNKYKNLELIIKPQGNSNYDYCHIDNNLKDIYSKQENDINKILTNILKVIQYVFLTKMFYIENIYLLLGDLFTDNLLWLILELFLQINMSNVNIFVPVDSSFITEPDFEALFKRYYNLLKQRNINLILFISADGRKIDTNKTYNYNDIIDFAEQYHFILHPTISASNIHKWIKNYDWWMRHVDMPPAIMEARNNDWTQDKIDTYLNVLNHIFDKRIEMCNNDIEKFAYHYFIGDGKNNTLPKIPYYDIIKPIFTNKNNILCSLQNTLCFDVSDNTLVPCHQIAHEQFRAAKLEDNKLISQNDVMFANLHSITRKGLPKCVNCLVKEYCIGNCFAAQFKAHGDLFTPNETVCSLFQQKIIFLIKKLVDTQTIQVGIQNKWVNQSFLNSLNKLSKDIEEKK